MAAYVATIRHHSIARARQIEIEGTLTEAKKAAALEFGQEQRDYEITVYERYPGYPHAIVSTRRVGSRKWQDRA